MMPNDNGTIVARVLNKRRGILTARIKPQARLVEDDHD